MNTPQTIPTPVPMHGITRTAHSPSWRVCISYKGAMDVEYFLDSKYGGIFPALEAAKERRDQLLSFLPTGRQIAASKRRKNSANALARLAIARAQG